MNRAQIAFDGESLIVPGATFDESRLRTPATDERFAIARTQLLLALRSIERGFERGESDASKLVRRLGLEMHALRARLDADLWQQLVPIAQAHPVARYVHQDPFTRWSFEKPRGYSGDAELLDFIYGHESVAARVASATPLGRALYGYSSMAPAPAAVRERRDLLAGHVDRLAAARGRDTEILTIAAGHLREARRSGAFAENRIRRWVALDQDPASVAALAREYEGTSVEPLVGSVRGLLGETYGLGRFDFVYAAGLYDYLPRAAAVRLTKRCLDMLKPGGTFLFANFASDIVDDGYMETFMNWALILRSEAEMWDIVNASVDRNAVEARLEFGENRNIVYAILVKRD